MYFHFSSYAKEKNKSWEGINSDQSRQYCESPSQTRVEQFFSAAFTEETGSPDDENDLLIELKIMSCLGSHPNILNLFGACTIKGG